MPNPQNLVPIPKGVCLNPKGRPKGSRNYSTIAKKYLRMFLENTNPITRKKENIPIEDWIVLQDITSALKGKDKSIDRLLDRVYGKTGYPEIQVNNNLSLTQILQEKGL